jgi:hypothetical protein
MALEVIGVGMPRTGTLSLKTALEELGFGPCHHMTELFAHPERWPLWNRIGDGEDIDWDDVFGSYRSVTDAPGVYFWRDLVRRYPGAKVVLTERDPERWYDSMAATIFSPEHRQTLGATPVGALIGKLAQRAWPGRNSNLSQGAPPRELMVQMFKAHNAAVRAEVPLERLLVYQVSEGWGPLCGFLGVRVPGASFPRLNSSEEFHGIDVPA